FIFRMPSGIQDEDSLLKTFRDGLRFPYFGYNWDALFDCLRDLSWIKEPIVVIIHQVLPWLDREALRIYLEILSDSVRHWRRRNGHKLEVFFPEAVRSAVRNILS